MTKSGISAEMPAVHVVEDDAAVRLSLDSLFRSVGYTSRTYGTAQEFVESGNLESPGCLVLDIRLPGLSGLEFQARLAEGGVRMPIVLMTGHGDIPMTVRGMKGGAVDFLPKPFREQDMLDAVANAMAQDVALRASRGVTEALRARFETLSAREREVMVAVGAGKMNKQIAFDLGLAEVTVKIHRGNAMRKMAARTAGELVKMAASLAAVA